MEAIRRPAANRSARLTSTSAINLGTGTAKYQISKNIAVFEAPIFWPKTKKQHRIFFLTPSATN
jgi:hypothetical protein